MDTCWESDRLKVKKITHTHISSVIDVDAHDFRFGAFSTDFDRKQLHFAAILVTRFPKGFCGTIG